MKPLLKTRFDALAGYSRSPQLPLSAQELAWFQQADEKLLGIVSLDIHDHDFVYTVLGRDARGRMSRGIPLCSPSKISTRYKR